MPSIEPADECDRKLISNVHPAEWRNPKPAERYNLAVIGAGTAGLVAAAAAAGLGAKVALIERDLMGGDCLNLGCVPSKALLRAARAFADARNPREYGVVVPPGTAVDFATVMTRMRQLRAALSENDSASRFRDLGVEVFIGEGRFAGPDSIEVAGQKLRFGRALIATGSRAAILPIQGISETGFLTNETIFSLTDLPRRLVVIGGGPLGCEMAQAFSRFGSQVTLLEAEPSILPREDADAAKVVKNALLLDGIDIIENCLVRSTQTSAKENLAQLESAGGRREIAFDQMLIAAGRVPAVEGLGLDAAGVSYDRRSGVKVDDYLRTSNPRIFAAGDVCSAYRFTHVADAMARIVVRNALFYGREKFSALTIPWCTYTDPEMAHVGSYEVEAQRRGIGVRVFVQPFAEVDRAILDGETEGFLKILVREGTDRIVGATLVARHAGEMISELTLAIARGVGLSKIAGIVHPYPTQAEAIRKLADAYNRTRLTSRVKWLLRQRFRWMR